MLPLAPRPRPLRVLCVEEDAIQRKLIKACLDGLGAESLFAARSDEAVATFRQHPVDLVLMDIDMHSAAELAAFEAIRATPFRGHKVPILAVTDNDCGWDAQDYRQAGFAGLFVKPLEPLRLYARIDETLAEHHLPPLFVAPPPPSTEGWYNWQVA